MKTKYAVPAYAVSIILILIFLLINSVTGVRGTDQYWYTANTETLMRNEPPITNFRFPGMLLRENIADPFTHFTHNGPLLYINKYLGTLMNGSVVSAWKYSNIFWWLGATLLLYLTLIKLTETNVAALGALLYLTTPIVFWQAANFLQEMWLSFLAAAFLYVTCTIKYGRMSLWFWPLLIFVGTVSHPFFLLTSVFIVVAGFYYRRNYYSMFSMCVALILAMVFKDMLFPSSFPPDIKTIITSTIPGETNLHWQFDDNEVAVSRELMTAKFSEAVKKQFFTLSAMPLTLVTNGGIAAMLILLVISRLKLDRVLTFTIYSVAAWGAMIVLLQNQPRYQLLILPALITCVVVLLGKLPRPSLHKYLLIAATVLFFVADVYLLQKVRSDIQQHEKFNLAVTEALSNLPADKRYAVIDTERDILKLVIARLAPATGLMIDPRYIQSNNLKKVLALYRADYVLTSTPELLENLELDLRSVAQGISSESDFQLSVFLVNAQ